MVTPVVNSYDYSLMPYTFWWYDDVQWRPMASGKSRYVQSSHQRPQSVSNPRRRDGTRAPSPWEHDFHYASSATADTRGIAVYWREKYTNYCVDAPQVLDVRRQFSKKLENRAMLKALTSLKDSKVNLGVMLAEARQTAQLAATTANRVGRAMEAWADRRPGDLRRLARSVASGTGKIPSSYLEMQYGWAPAIQDVYNSAEALADAWHGSGRSALFTVSGRATSEDEFVLPWYDYMVSQPYRGSIKERAQVSLCMELPLTLLEPLVQTGLTNPFEVAWEKVPWSFVADWFVPVGDWLHTLDAGAYASFREGSVSRIYRINAESRAVARSSDYSVSGLSPGFIRSGRFERSVIKTLPTFPPLPSLKNPLSLDHLANGLSLLSQQTKRILKAITAYRSR